MQYTSIVVIKYYDMQAPTTVPNVTFTHCGGLATYCYDRKNESSVQCTHIRNLRPKVFHLFTSAITIHGKEVTEWFKLSVHNTSILYSALRQSVYTSHNTITIHAGHCEIMFTLPVEKHRRLPATHTCQIKVHSK